VWTLFVDSPLQRSFLGTACRIQMRPLPVVMLPKLQTELNSTLQV
jgi:hypothetical protein